MTYRRSRERTGSNPLLWALIALVFTGIFLYITWQAESTDISKEIETYSSMIESQEATANNLLAVLNRYADPVTLAKRAADLGMISPNADQIRSIDVP